MSDRIGPYEVLGVLGAGAQATTLRAAGRDGEIVALKVFAEQDEDVAVREAGLLDGVDCRGVAAFKGIERGTWRGDSVVAVAQEFIDGVSAQQIIDEHRFVSEDDLVGFARQLLTIVGELHDLEPAIVHRDIKPANVIVTPDGTVYLVDFGGGLAADDDGEVIGTVGYSAPEQYFGEVTPRGDLYSVGATLLHLATRRHPSEFPMRDLRYDLAGRLSCGPELTALITRLLEPSEHRRPHDAAGAIALLDAPMETRNSHSRARITRSERELTIEVLPDYRLYAQASLGAVVFSALLLVWFNVLTSLLVLIAVLVTATAMSYPTLRRERLVLTRTHWHLRRTFRRKASGPMRPGFALRSGGTHSYLHDYESLVASRFAASASPAEIRQIAAAINTFVADEADELVQFNFNQAGEVAPERGSAPEEEVEEASRSGRVSSN